MYGKPVNHGKPMVSRLIVNVFLHLNLLLGKRFVAHCVPFARKPRLGSSNATALAWLSAIQGDWGPGDSDLDLSPSRNEVFLENHDEHAEIIIYIYIDTEDRCMI